jgi:CPA1 family monovalent cation:H+ antiporter
MLQERDFERLQQQYPMLREKIDLIVRQRQRAMEVWRQFESGERQHEPLPDLGRTAADEAPADADEAVASGEAAPADMEPDAPRPAGADAPPTAA